MIAEYCEDFLFGTADRTMQVGHRSRRFIRWRAETSQFNAAGFPPYSTADTQPYDVNFCGR